MSKTKKAHPGRCHRKELSLVEIISLFPDDDAAEDWFELQRWPNGICCPKCGSLRYSIVKSRKPMPYRCKDCRGYFSVCKGTMMQSSKLGYQEWAVASYLVATSLNGVSNMKLHRDLKIRQPSAWHLAQRIREGFTEGKGIVAGPVEMDEAHFGGKRKNMSNAKRKELADSGRGPGGKTAVVGVKDRATKQVAARPVESVTKVTDGEILEDTTEPDAPIYTDEGSVHEGLSNHETVNHSAGEYVKGKAHAAGVESFWSMLKRGYYGMFHHLGVQHLYRYVNEFAGRHNIRDLDTIHRMTAIARGMDGKQLRYRDLVA